MTRGVLALALLICGAAPAAADPVSMAIATSLAAAFTTTTGILLAPAAITALTAITSVAIGVGLNVVAQAMTRSTLPGGEGVALSADGTKLPVKQSIPAQRLVLGRVTSSGAVFFQRDDPPFIWIGFLLDAHRSGGFEALTINGKVCQLESIGGGILGANSAPFFTGATRYIEMSYRDGRSDQAIDPIIARDFPTMPATFRQRGHATAVIKARYGATDNTHKDVYGSDGGFNALFRRRGALLPDPRVVGFDPADESTWTWGRGASLGLARFLIHRWPNMRYVDPARIDWDRVAAAADIDDKWIATKDGARERNHTVDGIILSTADASEAVRQLLTASDGLLVRRAGSIYCLPGAPRVPIGTITPELLAGGFERTTEQPDRNLINTVKTEALAEDRDYNTVVGPVLVRSDLVTLDGAPRDTTLSLPFTLGENGFSRPQRLAKRKLLQSREPGGLSMLLALPARRYAAGDIVRFDGFAEIGFPGVDGVYQVTRTARTDDGGRVQLEAVRYDATRFAWDAASEQADFVVDDDVLNAEAA